MNVETPETVAKDMIAQADILAMMGNQPLSSLKVVERLKKFAERILKAVKPEEPGNPPAESAEVAENAEPDEKKAIGNFAGAGKVVSYAIDEMYAVTVTAHTTGDGAWMFKGIKNGETEIMGTILGGKWKAMQYCKFLRNGIVSRAKKVWKNHHRRAEKAASALAGARSDAAGAN